QHWGCWRRSCSPAGIGGPPGWVHALPAGVVDVRLFAPCRAECSYPRPAGLFANRVRGGEPDVYSSLSISRRLDPTGADRACQKVPGEISYATTGVGRLTHLTGELLQREAGINLLLVPYTGGPSHAVTDVATGRVSMIIEGYSGIAGAARSGSIKLIAVASAKRLAEFPDVPTVAETIPGFQAT